MQLQDKDRIAYYSALSIFFGAIELFIPKPLPFFRLGLANIPILLALEFPFSDFIMVALLKGIGNSYVSGNLFSIFGAISIAHSLSSALVMYGAKHLFKERISSYGLSMLGAFTSTFMQILLFSLYLGSSILSLLPIMLMIALITSNLVAMLSYKIDFIDNIPDISIDDNDRNSSISIAALIISAFAVMALDSIAYALIAFLLSLSFQALAKRRIRIIPYIIASVILIISSLITPRGRVLLKAGIISITENALEIGILNALSICSCIALSQGYSELIKPKGILGKTLGYFTIFISNFRKVDTRNIIERTKRALYIEENANIRRKHVEIRKSILVLYSIIFSMLAIASKVI